MEIHRGTFLGLVTSLAAGAGGGYVASEKDLVPHMQGTQRAEKAHVEPVAQPVANVAADAGASVTTTSAAVDAGPKCDDSIGEADACPPIGLPTVEGGCGSLATVRCNDFKQTMKPRVAQAAIACLNKMSAGERCDPKRVELCAHMALMNACDDASSVTSSCDKLASSSNVNRAECTMAMSGLKEAGRDAMMSCVQKHPADKGVLGCEAAPIAKAVAQ